MTKQEARTLYKQKRAALTTAERNRFDDLILIHFQQIPLPPVFYVHTYLAMKHQQEIETDHLLHYLEFRNPELKIVIPKIMNGKLVHIEYDEQVEMELNSLGISEPVGGNFVNEKDLDIILVPLLAFDETGNRVGYGKGYYDQFLQHCRPDALKIGLSYFDAAPRISNTEHFDIPLNYCVTPHRIYEFG
jgi:5-formyltetrahydrofolate cyclo-ligase